MSGWGRLGGSRLTIGIHFDLICPWCLIGKRQFEFARERFAQEYPGVAVEAVWHPVQLLPDLPENGLPFAEFYQRRLGSAAAVRERQRQVTQAAHAVGLELDLAAIERMPNTAKAHRLLNRVASMGEPVLYEALLDRLFAAYFQRGENIGDEATLQALAAEAGVPLDKLAAPLGEACPTLAATAVAGVPHFVFNGRLSLSGAYDAATLFEAMTRVVQAPVVA